MSYNQYRQIIRMWYIQRERGLKICYGPKRTGARCTLIYIGLVFSTWSWTIALTDKFIICFIAEYYFIHFISFLVKPYFLLLVLLSVNLLSLRLCFSICQFYFAVLKQYVKQYILSVTDVPNKIDPDNWMTWVT